MKNVLPIKKLLCLIFIIIVVIFFGRFLALYLGDIVQWFVQGRSDWLQTSAQEVERAAQYFLQS